LLDKNTKHLLDENLSDVKMQIEQNSINLIMYSDPSNKSALLNMLIKKFEQPIIYLDFDLLYSGYAVSGMLHQNENVALFRPTIENLESNLAMILSKISLQKCIIIVDSLNGFFNLFNENVDSGRLVNSYIMLISLVAKMSDSILVVFSMAKLNEKSQWVLYITGKRLLEDQFFKKFYLEKEKSAMVFSILNNNDITKNTRKINF